MGRVIPYASYMFRVDISWGPGGRHVADFSECTGLGAQITSETIEEGGRNNSVRRLPSRIKFDNVKLKRGYVRNSELFPSYKLRIVGHQPHWYSPGSCEMHFP